MEPNTTVVLYPSLGVGHLIPMVELAKLFLQHHVAVAIAVPTSPEASTTISSSSSTVARLASSNPSISFHILPPPSDPHPDPSPFVRMLDALRLSAPSLLALLRSLPSVAALVIDLFCMDAVAVAAELDVPSYFYYTSGAGALAALLHLPYYYSTITASLKDMGKTLLHFPGVPPLPASHVPFTMQNRADRSCGALVGHYARVAEVRGVLVNTFEWLEARALGALRDGVCIPDRPTPPVYCVGPLVAQSEAVDGEKHACLAWLDAQPRASVVLLCFGSMGAFPAAQLQEIARGLESSGHRFLWVVRAPPSKDPAKFLEPQAEPDLKALLPEGFLERTRDRGMVVTAWAPQAAVLRHAAAGAFVTHCGWNSVLEAVAAGVPMVCWPQYAEQRVNKVLMVEEMKVGVAMEGYDEELVKAEEVEAKVRLVMGSKEGEVLRARLAVAREKAAEAVMDGGPSRGAFAKFLEDLRAPKRRVLGNGS